MNNEANQISFDAFMNGMKLIIHHQEACLREGSDADWVALRRSIEAYVMLVSVWRGDTSTEAALIAKFMQQN